jgi:hypothetical protein
MLALRMLQKNDAWLLVFFTLVLTAVFTGIRLSETFVEMVLGLPTVLQLLAQCTMEWGFSVHQKRQRPGVFKFEYGHCDIMHWQTLCTLCNITGNFLHTKLEVLNLNHAPSQGPPSEAFTAVQLSSGRSR